MLFLIQGSLSAQTVLNKTITLQKTDYRLDEVLNELKKTHGLSFSYGVLPQREDIRFDSKTRTLREILDKALSPTNFEYQEVKGKILIIKKSKEKDGGRATISGFITDIETGEALIGTTIYDQISGSGIISNNYGFFSLTLPKDSVSLSIAYLGFKTETLQLNLRQNLSLNFEMTSANKLLEEVTVEANTYEQIELSPQMSAVNLTSKQIENVPMILGEHDLLKAIQLLPGIQGGTEASSGIYVRGGGPDQNLILLDGVPVYNTSHMFGFFSVFNGDAINNTEVIKGGFPARYGGRLSSVIDISMKEGNNQKLSGKGAIGLISSKFLLEGPINNKTSFIISGRRTYFDILAIPFNLGEDVNYYFYDFNTKINHRFSERDRLFVSFYGGNDTFNFSSKDTHYTNTTPIRLTTDTRLGWGNIVSVIRWNHVFNPRLFGNFSTSFSRFRFNTYDERYSTQSERTETLKYNSGIRDLAVRASFEYLINPNYEIRFGGSAIAHRFNTGVIDLSTEPDLEPSSREQIDAAEYAAYLENDFSIGKKLRLNAGIHTSVFDVDDKQYFSFQPRVSGRFLLTESLSFKASYSEMQQFIHLLTNSGVGLPTDLWVPTTKNVKPQFSRQTAFGVAKVYNKFEVTVEGYFKQMEGLIEYENGASYLSNDTNWENKIERGDGTSFGAELLIQKNLGRLTGWLGYTWSKTTRQFQELNFGREFPYKYDRRHDLSATGSYKLTDKCTISATWVYSTGNVTTLPLTKYLAANQQRRTGIGDFDHIYNLVLMTYNTQIENFDRRNNYRLRNYDRLDLSISWAKKKKNGTRTWTLGVYNAYNRLNTFFVFFEDELREVDDSFYLVPVLKQQTLFPAIPFVNYSFKF